MEERRIVVTGLGTINPLGNDVATTWSKALAGKSGISRIDCFDASTYNSQVAGEVRDFDFLSVYSEKLAKRASHLDKYTHFALGAAKQAWEHAGFEPSKTNFDRAGVIIGTGIGGMNIHRVQTNVFFNKGHRRVSPFYVPALIGNMAAGVISIELGLKGPNMSLQTACASSNHAIASSMQVIQSGMADVIVSGGTESIVEPLTMSGFCNMRALSTGYNDQPTKASRPFDKGRDGFVMGEGAAMLVLEELEHAKKRGAEIFCELVSVGMSGDAFDMVAPCTDGDGAYRAMDAAFKFRGIDPNSVDYINCHGTSTPLGDVAETQAIDRLYREAAAKKFPWIGSTKSMTGHLIGAAAGIEALFCVLAIKEGKIPPNINIDQFEEKIPIDQKFFNTKVVEQEVNVALSNSFGFGGHNAVAIFKSAKNI